MQFPKFHRGRSEAFKARLPYSTRPDLAEHSKWHDHTRMCAKIVPWGEWSMWTIAVEGRIEYAHRFCSWKRGRS